MGNILTSEVSAAAVVIDGCAVPHLLYDRVHLQACTLGKTQFIGVIYNQPAELKPEHGEAAFDWGKICHRQTMMRLHLAAGEHLEFIVDQSRDELLKRSDIAMILWINPWSRE